MKEFTCIICPMGCRLTIDEKKNVTGNLCPRGEKYAIEEITHPKRTITSTVKTIFKDTPRLSVKTDGFIPKELVFTILKDLDDILIDKHVKIGDIIIKNVRDTGVNIVATKETEQKRLGGTI